MRFVQQYIFHVIVFSDSFSFGHNAHLFIFIMFNSLFRHKIFIPGTRLQKWEIIFTNVRENDKIY